MTTTMYNNDSYNNNHNKTTITPITTMGNASCTAFIVLTTTRGCSMTSLSLITISGDDDNVQQGD